MICLRINCEVFSYGLPARMACASAAVTSGRFTRSLAEAVLISIGPFRVSPSTTPLAMAPASRLAAAVASAVMLLQRTCIVRIKASREHESAPYGQNQAYFHAFWMHVSQFKPLKNLRSLSTDGVTILIKIFANTV